MFFKKDKASNAKNNSPVYRYEELKEHGFRPPQETPYAKQIVSHMERFFPNRQTRVFHEIASEFLHVDVYVMQAPNPQSYHVIYTTGMSAMPMTLPEEISQSHKGLERAELMLFLPAEWDVCTGYETDRDVPFGLWWPIGLMKNLARFPHEYQTWLAWGHTIPNGADYEPYHESTALSGVMLASLGEEISCMKAEDGTEINLYCLLPLYREEMEYKLQMGAEALLQKLSTLNGGGLVIFPDRPNVCK